MSDPRQSLKTQIESDFVNSKIEFKGGFNPTWVNNITRLNANNLNNNMYGSIKTSILETVKSGSSIAENPVKRVIDNLPGILVNNTSNLPFANSAIYNDFTNNEANGSYQNIFGVGNKSVTDSAVGQVIIGKYANSQKQVTVPGSGTFIAKNASLIIGTGSERQTDTGLMVFGDTLVNGKTPMENYDSITAINNNDIANKNYVFQGLYQLDNKFEDKFAEKQDVLRDATITTTESEQNIKTLNNMSLLGPGDLALTALTDIDSELSSTSTNPIQNKAVTEAINNIKAPVYDNTITATSPNAVKSSALYSAFYNTWEQLGIWQVTEFPTTGATSKNIFFNPGTLNEISFRKGSGLLNIQTAPPQDPSHCTTKSYVDSVDSTLRGNIERNKSSIDTLNSSLSNLNSAYISDWYGFNFGQPTDSSGAATWGDGFYCFNSSNGYTILKPSGAVALAIGRDPRISYDKPEGNTTAGDSATGAKHVFQHNGKAFLGGVVHLQGEYPTTQYSVEIAPLNWSSHRDTGLTVHSGAHFAQSISLDSTTKPIKFALFNPDTLRGSTSVLWLNRSNKDMFNLTEEGSVKCVVLTQTSDKRLKRDISTMDNRYAEFFDKLNPVKFRYAKSFVDNDNFETGLIAQEVQEALHSVGLSDADFNGLDTSNKDQLSLSYTSFIALLIKEVQTLKKQVKELLTKEEQ